MNYYFVSLGDNIMVEQVLAYEMTNTILNTMIIMFVSVAVILEALRSPNYTWLEIIVISFFTIVTCGMAWLFGTTLCNFALLI